MASNSKIEWTDHTWNPWYGCPADHKRTEACDHCYARAWAKLYQFVDFDKEIRRSSNYVFRAPLNTKKYKSGDRVFVCSLSDFFHGVVSHDLLSDAWEIINARPDLTWIFLTKRPENITQNVNWQAEYEIDPNLWLGVTAENQEQADKRIPLLLKIPAAVHFVSCEPLLGPVDISQYLGMKHEDEIGIENTDQSLPEAQCLGMHDPWVSGLDWVIAGGESGAYARPMGPDWVRSLRDQCLETETAFFFKQWEKKRGRILDGKVHDEFPKANRHAGSQ